MAYALLFVLTGTAAVAGLLTGYRLYRDTPLKAVIASMAIWMILIAVPPHLLGWAGWLTPLCLGLSSLFSSAAVVFLALWRVERRRDLVRAALLATGRLPLRGLAEAWQSKSLVLLGPVALLLLAAWTAYLAYLAPSCSWDGLWYHESIIGFSIQHHGFDWVEVPRHLEFVNGYPRMSEMFNLVAVLYSGRCLVEIVPSVMMVIAFTGMVGLVRPLTASPVHAVGWASVLVLLPAVVLQLRSTLTDVTFLAGFTLALYFVTRPRLRADDMVIGAILTGMLGVMKGTGVAVAPMLFTVAAVRILRAARADRSRRWLLPVGAVVVSAAVIFAPTYVRNGIRQGNPFWPVHYTFPVLGLDLAGPGAMNMSRRGALGELFALPKPGQRRDTRDNGYGNTLPFLAPPLLIAALAALARRLARRQKDDAVLPLLWGLLAVVPSLLLSPGGLWWARLNLHAVVVLLMLMAWVIGGIPYRRLAEGVLGALVVGALLTLFWSKPNWDVSSKLAERLASASPEQRERTPILGTMLSKWTALALDKELGDGAITAFDGAYPFVANLWNLRFTNRLVYLGKRPAGDPRPRLDALNPDWVVVKKGGAWDKAIRSDTSRWCEVGKVNKKNLAYRRCGPQKNGQKNDK